MILFDIENIISQNDHIDVVVCWSKKSIALHINYYVFECKCYHKTTISLR